MGLNAAVVRVVVTDANIPINLIQVQYLEILGRLSGYEFVVDEVIREVTYPDQLEALQSMLARMAGCVG